MADQEQCSYCKQFYPAPVSLHHTLEECRLGEAPSERTRPGAALLAQLEAAREALLVFAERENWLDLDAAVWYGPKRPWKLAQKALEGK